VVVELQVGTGEPRQVTVAGAGRQAGRTAGLPGMAEPRQAAVTQWQCSVTAAAQKVRAGRKCAANCRTANQAGAGSSSNAGGRQGSRQGR